MANLTATIGIVYVAGALIYMAGSGTPPFDAALMRAPLAIIFAAVAWAMRDSMQMVMKVVFAVAMVVATASVVLAWIFGY